MHDMMDIEEDNGRSQNLVNGVDISTTGRHDS